MSSPMNLPISTIMDKWALKVIVATHFLLTVWALLVDNFLSSGYLYMNTILILTGLWSIAMQDSKDSIQMFFIFHIISILTDIIFLGVSFGPSQEVFCHATSFRCSDFRFSAGMAIINLLIKPLSAFFPRCRVAKKGWGLHKLPWQPSVQRLREHRPAHSNQSTSRSCPAPPIGNGEALPPTVKDSCT